MTNEVKEIQLKKRSYEELQEEIAKLILDKVLLQKQVVELQQNNIILEKYLELICDLGYDYDGLTKAGDLQDLINELCRYASLGRAYNTTEPIYENNGKKYNILHEELKENKYEKDN